MALFPPPPRIRNLEISPYWNTSVHSLIFDTWEEVEWRAPCINKIRIHPKNLSVQTHEHPPNYRGGWGESSTDSEAWNNKEQEKTKHTSRQKKKKREEKKSPSSALHNESCKTFSAWKILPVRFSYCLIPALSYTEWVNTFYKVLIHT